MRPLEPHKELTTLLGELPQLLSTAASVVATGRPMTSAAPVVSLSLGPTERAFLQTRQSGLDQRPAPGRRPR